MQLYISGASEPREVHRRFRKALARTKLTSLKIFGVDFDHAVVEIMQNLFSTRRWEHVSISCCDGLIHDVIKILGAANLGELCINLRYTGTTRSNLFHILSSPWLRTVTLHNIFLGKNIACALAQYISSNGNLDSLFIECTYIHPPLLTEILPGFESNKGIKTIGFSYCEMEDEHVSSILMAISRNNKLEGILVNGNKCYDKTLQTISSFLEQENCSLRSIDISRQQDGVKKESLFQLLLLLKYNSTVQQLHTTHNKLDDETLREISDLLVHNCVLVDLDLGWNAFTCHGLTHILASNLAAYQGLQCLQIDTESIVLQGELLNALQQGIQDNWSLNCLDVFISDSWLQYYLNLNLSKRRILRDDAFPVALWPLLLERAMRHDHVPFSKQKWRKWGNLHVYERVCQKESMIFYFLLNLSTRLWS